MVLVVVHTSFGPTADPGRGWQSAVVQWGGPQSWHSSHSQPSRWVQAGHREAGAGQRLSSSSVHTRPLGAQVAAPHSDQQWSWGSHSPDSLTAVQI